jgi:hypothetical protein
MVFFENASKDEIQCWHLKDSKQVAIIASLNPGQTVTITSGQPDEFANTAFLRNCTFSLQAEIAATAPAVRETGAAVTGRDILKGFNSENERDQIASSAYVKGIRDFVAAINEDGVKTGIAFPKNVTFEQLKASVVKLLAAHPEKGDENAARLITTAFMNDFPG